MNQRLMLYRKVAAARREDEIDRVLEEAADRYGPLPDSVLNLADYGRIRVMADRLGVESHRPGRPYRRLKVQTAGEGRSRAARGAGAAAPRPHARPACGSQAEPRRDWDSGLGLGAADRARPPVPSPQSPSPKKSGKYANAAPSWWTARARDGEVKPGFTKEEILQAGQGRSARAGRGVRAGRRRC